MNPSDIQNKLGILILTDIVNYTPQSIDLQTDNSELFLDGFQETIKQIAESNGVEFIETSMGDCALMFIGIDDLDTFIRLVTQLRDKSVKREFDAHGFQVELRFAAHFGNFKIKMIDKRMESLPSAEGIRVFRMEKWANANEVLITDYLWNIIKDRLEQNKIGWIHKGDCLLKGFDEKEIKAGVYLLEFQEEIQVINDLFEQKQEKLRTDAQFIPVMGGLYPEIPMEKNFINLEIKSEHARMQFRQKGRDGFDDYLEIRDFRMKQAFRSQLTAGDLYENFAQGVIFGLPGSGKTTILKYFTFKEFQKTPKTPPKPPSREEHMSAPSRDSGDSPLIHKNGRVILLVNCRDILSFPRWFENNPAYQGQKTQYSINAILEYLTYGFLFRSSPFSKLSPDERVELLNAVKSVRRAFTESKLTILIDALDEAPGNDVKASIKKIVKALYEDLRQNNRDDIRLYLTSRYSEKETYFRKAEIPVFEVCPLSMAQLTDMARAFYGEDSEVYLAFIDVVWQEEIAARIAGTPLTALLVLSYFQVFRKFDTRYVMYDILIRFILLQIWPKIKDAQFEETDMEDFFLQARREGLIKQDDIVGKIYDAVTLLSWDYIPESRTMKENDIFTIFEKFCIGLPGICSEDTAREWTQRLINDHLMIKDGLEDYIFIHSTMMEFLAARFIAQKLKNSQYLQTIYPANLEDALQTWKENLHKSEAFPIASGASPDAGFYLLRQLKKLAKKPSANRNALFVTAFKTLAEIENLVVKTEKESRSLIVKQEFRNKIESEKESSEWMYRSLKKYLVLSDERRMKFALSQFHNVSRLSLSNLLQMISYTDFADTSSSVYDLREQILFQFVKSDIAQQWVKTNKEKLDKEALERIGVTADHIRKGILLRLDARSYHPDDKNFRYYQLHAGKELIGILGSPNLKHNSSVNSVIFSSDGKILMSGSSDNTIRLWDVSTGKEIRTFTGHQSYVLCVSLSTDGKKLVSGSYDKTIKLWDVATGKEIRTFKGHRSYVWSVSLSVNGKMLVSGSYDKTIKLWDVATGKKIRTFKGHRSYVWSMNLSSDAKALVSGSSDNTVRLWDVATGKEIRKFTGHKSSVRSVSLSSDGKSLVSGSSDKTVRLWDVATGKEIRRFTGHLDSVMSVSLSADGKTLISGSSDKTVRLWDVAIGKEIRTFRGHHSSVWSMSLSADGKTLASGSYDNTVKIWDAMVGKEIRKFTGHLASVNSVSLSADGKKLASGSLDNTIRLWDICTGKEIQMFRGHLASINSVGLSADGKILISGSSDKTVRLWDAATGKEIRTFIGHENWINSVSLSSDSKTLVSASSDNTVKLWDAITGKKIRTFWRHHDSVKSVSLLSDGKTLVSGSDDNTVRLWDTATGKEIRMFMGHQSPVNSVSLSSDGKTLVSGSSDNTVKLWDAATGKEIRTFTGHQHSVRSVSLSSDDKTLVSGSDDNTVRLWDPATGKCIKTITLLWIPTDVKFFKNNPKRFVVAGANGTVALFDLGAV